MKTSLLSFALIFCIYSFAQNPGLDRGVRSWATVQNSPPQITLNWQSMPDAISYSIYRKAKTATTWGSALVTGLSSTTVQWTDTTVQIGVHYEYRILKTGSSYQGNGYINSGIEIPVTEFRGVLLFVYDTIGTTALTNEIKRWITDTEGDGWKVKKIGINQNDAVTSVKAKIVAAYNQDTARTKTIFLFGRVPIPYSGNIAPDGHVPDHQGAWPADSYYADMNGNWTDATINNTGATQVRNQNVPGDGKFDQSNLPSNLELQIGRVDMRNLGGFTSSETQLLKKYLDKNHAYRVKIFSVMNRGLIDDNFTSYGEGFPSSCYSSYSTLCNPANIVTTDYRTTMTGSSYQWSYGCGAGSYNSCSGVTTSTDFITDSLQTIFTVLFGSYFGDWDSPSNNLLRMALGSGTTLTNCWSGRPFWYFHHMAMGENIGYSAMLSMNNQSLYFSGSSARGVHTALMGDPTLRAAIIAPVSNVIATKNGLHCNISWTASTDNVLGYYIYMKNDTMTDYIRLNQNIITGTTYTDSCLLYPGIYSYMVRAVRLEQTPSGTYYNLSTGISDTAWNSNHLAVNAIASYSQNGNIITFTNNSTNAITYLWNFGDNTTSTLQNPTHTYLDGNYTVTLIASNGCHSDTIFLNITVATGIANLNDESVITISPNPSTGKFELSFQTNKFVNAEIKIYSISGAVIYSTKVSSQTTAIDLTNQNAGLYLVRIDAGENKIWQKRIVIQK